ncbi:hypothetical protein [Geofilum rubicundum]|nr:hypothetical protein [Geofilum rubicundum]
MPIKQFLIILFLIFFAGIHLHSQPVPAIDENIDALVTFGKEGETAWGDDDFVQIIFLAYLKHFRTLFSFGFLIRMPEENSMNKKESGIHAPTLLYLGVMAHVPM